jgi:SAM-dependent methyltransferase
MDEFEQRFGANPDQAQYWNSEAGRKWVEHDAAMNELLDAMTGPLLQRAGIAAGEHALDIGCGAGASTEQVARAVGATGRVVGLDISAPLLSLARARCAAFDHVSFENADAQVHPFEAQEFDVLVSRFGVMFFSDPPEAFSNLRRALRRDGRLHFVCWAGMAENAWFTVPLAVAKRHVDAPEAEPAPARAPGPLAFAEPAYVEDILAAAGFREVRIDTTETAMTSSAPPEQQAEFYLRMGPAARLIAETPPGAEVMQALTAEPVEELRMRAVEDGYALGATVHYVSARA